MSEIRIKCSTPSCEGFVEYRPSKPPIVFALKELLGEQLNFEISHEMFKSTVTQIITSDNFEPTETETIYLTCNAIAIYGYWSAISERIYL